MSSIRDRIAAAEQKPNVTAAELALLTGFGVDTIRRAGKSGEIPSIACRGCVRYPREAAMNAMRRRGVPLETLRQLRQQQQQATENA